MVFFIIISCIFTFILTNTIEKNKISELKKISLAIKNSVDDQISRLDSVSLNIANSDIIREMVSTKLDYNGLFNILSSLIGTSQSIVQINIYDLKQGILCAGAFDGKADDRASNRYWYDEVMVRDGEKYISVPHEDDRISSSLGLSPRTKYISLIRLLYDKNNKEIGIIEVKQKYSSILKSCYEYISSEKSRLLIFDNYGYKFFPLDRENDNYYYRFTYNLPQGEMYNIKSEQTGKKEMVQTIASKFSNLIYVFILDEHTIMKPVTTTMMTLIYMNVGMLIMLLIILLNVTKKISNPIKKIKKKINALNIDEIGNIKPVPSNEVFQIEEINSLAKSFDRMSEKINDSVNNLLLAQSQEMQSRMLALQNQINPHFLYNSLSTISAMAEEGMSDEIVMMCENMSDILRYISQDKSMDILVIEEIMYTEKYLNCMKARFPMNLTYKFNIQDELKDVLIPKLVVQLLVENSIKYSSKIIPPWHIDVEGYVKDNKWFIKVTDNGPGFNKEVTEQINEKIKMINRTNILPSLKLDGMGLMNIYIRLYLMYGEERVFDIQNNDVKGASVEIGGLIKKNN